MFVIFRSQLWNDRELHFHSGWEILLILTEGGEIHINNVVYPVRHGSLFVMNSTDYHRNVGNNDKQRYHFYATRFDPEEVSGVSTPGFDLTACFRDHRNFNHHRQLSGDQVEYLLKLIDRLEYCLSPQCSLYGKEVHSKIRLAEMLIYVNSLYDSAESATEVRPGKKSSDSISSDRISPVIQYIQEHYTEKLSLDSLAEAFFISKAHLCRSFRNATGTTLNAYVTNIRLLRAKELLRTGYSVNFAGEAVGFSSPSHFIRTFTKLEGMSPRRYTKLSTTSTEFRW